MERKTKKERLIKHFFEGLTDEQAEAVAGEMVSMNQRESFKVIDELYQNKIWEK